MSDAIADADALIRRGDVPGAYQTLLQAAEAGDGGASYVLGYWRMEGAIIRRDLGESRTWFGRAAEAGFDDAWPPYLAMLANGSGGTAPAWDQALALLRERASTDPLARRQCSLLDAMDIDADGNPAKGHSGQLVSTSPAITAFQGFLTPAECAYLIDAARPQLQPAVIVHPTTGEMMPDPIRTSLSAAFPIMAEDAVIHAINRRIAAVSGTNYQQGEPTQILAYQGGQEYKAHVDALPPGTDNQRVATLLVYLNDNYAGGETHFLATDSAIRGRTGDAILFRNVGDDGEPDMSTQHAGRPVTGGTKFLLSKWIRARPLDLAGPPGRPF